MAREAEVHRVTKETDVSLTINLDGRGLAAVATGVGFLDHMLTLLAGHGMLDLTCTVTGDLETGAHHSVEDVGLTLGQALAQAAGDKKGIARYGFCLLPMDEVLAEIALDLSGRPQLAWDVPLASERVGDFETCLAREFFVAMANSAGLTLHAALRRGGEAHHCLEAVFKGTGRALRMALEHDPRRRGEVPSTKGVL